MLKNILKSTLIVSLLLSNHAYSQTTSTKFDFENEEILQEVNNRKISLIILPFKGWNGIQEKFYQEMSNRLLYKELSSIKKFDIITDSEFYNLVNSIKIDENRDNILSFARDKQIKYIIIPKFKENSLDFNDLELTQTMFIPDRKVVFQLEVLDVSSGDIIYKTDKTLLYKRRQFGTNFYSGLEKAFKTQMNYLAKKIDETFLIKAQLKPNNGKPIIDKGSGDGVTIGSIFHVKTQEKTKDNFTYTNNSYFRVVETSDKSSNLILLSGNIPKYPLDAIESKNNPIFGGLITSFEDLDNISINIGEEQGVKVGQVYKVGEIVTYKDSKTGKEYNLGDKDKGLIVITETSETSSIAKALKGINDIKNGMRVSEYKDSYLQPFLKLAYYTFQPINKDVNKGSTIRLSSGFEHLVDSYFFDFGINMLLEPRPVYNGDNITKSNVLTIGGINNINLSAGYNFPIIREYLHVIPMLQFGLGSASIENNTFTASLIPKVALRASYAKFSLWAEAGFSGEMYLRQTTTSNTSSFIYGGGLSYIF
ncbi:MAG: hypothetical protein U0354_19500 [Candidatus Sericytochromatia bacterium]